MALKDWKVDRRNISWEEKKKSRQGYDTRGNSYGKLAIYVYHAPKGWVLRDTSSWENPEISPYFKTKSSALKFAKEYMRKN